MLDDKSPAAPAGDTSKSEAARKRAQNHFAAEKRDGEVRKEIERQHTAAMTQIAKLRALRLAKEEEERQAAANAPPPAPKARKPRRIT